MRGFILAAGFGTRLRPITDHLPKSLVSVAGKPLLDHALDMLSDANIKTIGVNAHYRADDLSAYRESSPCDFVLFHEKERILGTGGGIYNARSFLSGEDSFFVCNADIIMRFDLHAVIKNFLNSNLSCCLLCCKAKDSGTVYYNVHSGEYLGVPSEKPFDHGMSKADFIGATLYRKKFLDLLTPDDFSIVPVWTRAKERQHRVGVTVIDNCYWRDIGTPESLARIHFDILDGQVAIDTPSDLIIDRRNRRCYSKNLTDAEAADIGPCAWVEPKTIPRKCRITNSLVMHGAKFPDTISIDHRILTAYGDIPFGE